MGELYRKIVYLGLPGKVPSISFSANTSICVVKSSQFTLYYWAESCSTKPGPLLAERKLDRSTFVIRFCSSKNWTGVGVNTVPLWIMSPRTFFTSEYCPPSKKTLKLFKDTKCDDFMVGDSAPSQILCQHSHDVGKHYFIFIYFVSVHVYNIKTHSSI